MNWVEEQYADVALAKSPLMLKSIRERDFRANRLESNFPRVFFCTFNLCCLLFYSCMSN